MITEQCVSGEIESPFVGAHKVIKHLALPVQDSIDQGIVLVLFLQLGS